MSNIKSYLQTLFKMSGSQSAPKANSYIELNVQNGTTYVAPSDGYVSIASENTQGLARITVEGSCESGMNSWGGIEGTSSSLWVRVNKGDMVSFTLENLKEVYWARFIRTVGGGKILVPQRFKWRYSPCLRLKTSCAAWLNLRLAKATSLTKQSSCRFRQAQHLSTPLRQTASCLSRFFQKPGRRGSTHIRWLGPDNSVLKVMSVRVMALCRSISVFVKGSQFALTLIGLVTPRLRADSCPALETRDFSVVGG